MITKAPKVAFIGRTNVGKSSLFNKCIEEQKSLVSEIPGTTRDRFEADCIWRGAVIRVVDTGGLDVDTQGEIEKNVVLQSHKAMEEADCIAFVVDTTTGPAVEDMELARQLTKSRKPVVVIGNKADSAKLRARLEGDEWRSWPLARPLPVSAKQGAGVGDMLDVMTEALIKAGTPPVDITLITPMRIVVVGEPNVGKSTFLNSVLGQERFITANIPHTTREPNDVLLEHEGRQYLFIDTAGIRKMNRVRKVGTHLEKEGVERTLSTLDRAHVALFVVDISRGISGQDKHLAGVIAESGVSTLIVANKWDLIPDKTTTTINKFSAYIKANLPSLDYAPILFTSAITNQRTQNVFARIDEIFASRFIQLSDQEAKEFISKAISRHRPSRGKGVKSPRVVKFVQTRVNPPTFGLEVNLSRQDSLAESYLRFLENVLREQYGFVGTPIRLRVIGNRKSHTTRKNYPDNVNE